MIFSISFLLEGLQFTLAIGAFDTTDLITNVIGGITGWLLVRDLNKLFGNPVKTQRFLNLLSAAGTVVMVVLLILLKMNRLPIRYK